MCTFNIVWYINFWTDTISYMISRWNRFLSWQHFRKDSLNTISNVLRSWKFLLKLCMKSKSLDLIKFFCNCSCKKGNTFNIQLCLTIFINFFFFCFTGKKKQQTDLNRNSLQKHWQTLTLSMLGHWTALMVWIRTPTITYQLSTRVAPTHILSTIKIKIPIPRYILIPNPSNHTNP